MRTTTIYLLLSFFIISSCSNNRDSKPTQGPQKALFDTLSPPSVLITTARNENTYLDFKVKNALCQSFYINLEHLQSGESLSFNLDQKNVIQMGDGCVFNVIVKFPPGEIEITIFDSDSIFLGKRIRNTSSKHPSEFN